VKWLIPLAALAACGMLGSAPAHAQRAANLSGRDISPGERARDTMNRFAVCVVKARPTMVQSALAETSQARKIVALSNVAKSECLAGGFLRMDPPIFEGALYRALYLREFGDDPAVVRTLSEGAAAEFPDARLTFADCVVRTDPAAVHALLESAPVTAEEQAALAALGAAFAACIPADQQLQFSPGHLLAVLAQAIYKRAVQAASGGSLREAAE
jgi:hypothetical protein